MFYFKKKTFYAMLHIEVLADQEENFIVRQGTYKLGSQFNKNIFICEYKARKSLYNGLVTVDSIDDIKTFYFKTFNSTTDNENFTEETLPCLKYLMSWRNVIFDENQKYSIFEAICKIESLTASILNHFSINRCVLLYGIPGVGKTTFSKALLQKLAIRQNKKIFVRTVKCSSLISRYYGESMKILENIFNNEVPNTVYIFDEADSLLIDRRSVLARNEPLDSLRFVNSILSIIDRKERLLIFVTNLKDNLDQAFLSRCDFCFKFELPSKEQIYHILKLSIENIFLAEKKLVVKFSDFSNILNCLESCSIDDKNLYAAATSLIGYTPREIKKLVILSFDKSQKNISEFLENLERKKFVERAL